MIKSCKPNRETLLAVAISMAAIAPTQALDFDSNGIEGSITSELSFGSSWRVEEATDYLTSTNSDNRLNNNDGDSNYDKGDAVSQIVKGSHDLQVNYENYGAFVRGKYWYDYALSNNDVNYGQTTSDGFVSSTGPLDDSAYNELSKFSGAVILDAFVYGAFEVADMPLDLRLGKQVVSWGESTFISGGINAINSYDVASFRRPGATLKEGLIPVNMAYANIGLTDSLSAEVFYQLDFQEHVLEGCGTFFSTNDYVADGCGGVIIATDGTGDTDNIALAISRLDDELPSSDSQFGIALRYVSEALNDTEFGFYAMNIHSRTPMVNMVVAATAIGPTNAYQISYPEDQQLAAVSFATTVGTVAVSGEVTHKKNVPLQIASKQLIAAGQGNYVTGSGAPGSVGPVAFGLLGTGGSLALDAAVVAAYDASAADGGSAQIVDGYEKYEISQAQVTAIALFDQVGPADRITLINEVAYSYVHSLNLGDFGTRVDSQADNYTTESWAYRTYIVASFSDAFAGVNLAPGIYWSKDVKGYSDAFAEGEEKLSFSLSADYLSTYTASVSYSRYGGGETNINNRADRDFASLSLSMAF